MPRMRPDASARGAGRPGSLSVAPELLRALSILPLTEMAERSGLGYSTLTAYRAGRRTPSRASLECVLRVLESVQQESSDAAAGLRRLIGTDHVR